MIKERGPGPGPGPAVTSYFLETTRVAWVYKSRLGRQDLPGSTRLAWVYKSCLGLQVLPETTILSWDYKTSARHVDKRPTLNTGLDRRVIKKGGPGPARAQRARHTFLRLQDLPGTTSPAWVYKTCLGLQACMGLQGLPGTTSLDWVYKTCLGLQEYKSCRGLQVLLGTTSLAWDCKSCLRLQDLPQTGSQESTKYESRTQTHINSYSMRIKFKHIITLA